MAVQFYLLILLSFLTILILSTATQTFELNGFGCCLSPNHGPVNVHALLHGTVAVFPADDRSYVCHIVARWWYVRHENSEVGQTSVLPTNCTGFGFLQPSSDNTYVQWWLLKTAIRNSRNVSKYLAVNQRSWLALTFLSCVSWTEEVQHWVSEMAVSVGSQNMF